MRRLVIALAMLGAIAVLTVVVTKRGETPSSRPPESAAPRETSDRAADETAAEPLSQQQDACSVATEDGSSIEKVTVDNPFGSVRVTGGDSAVSVTKRIYLPDDAGQEVLPKNLPVEVRSETTPEGEYKVEVVPIEDTDLLDVIAVDLKVSVPAATPVEVTVTSGEARVSGFAAKVTVHGQAGKVTVSDCSGGVTASTTVGDVEIADAVGEIKANTSSGALFLDNVEGEITARTMSGMANVDAERADKLIVGSMNGLIDVKVRSPFSGQMEVRSMSGDIVVAIPASSNCRVRTATNTGPISCTLPLSAVERAGPNVSGRLGGGKGYVEVTNNSGAIAVKPLK